MDTPRRMERLDVYWERINSAHVAAGDCFIRMAKVNRRSIKPQRLPSMFSMALSYRRSFALSY